MHAFRDRSSGWVPQSWLLVAVGLWFLAGGSISADAPSSLRVLAPPDLFAPLTEPPCSYCSTQHLKNLIRPDDRVVAWLRGAHNGGAAPLRHFLAGPRVVNDTYGLFFYDPDGGYVAVYKKDYGYKVYGWQKGVLLVQGPDGTIWSALRGLALEGPRQGERLERVPSLLTDWSYWMMLHPESTAYDLFDGNKYSVVDLPMELSEPARKSMGPVDPRLAPLANVLGVEIAGTSKAYLLDDLPARACINDTLGGQPITIFWYQPTRTAVAFQRDIDGQALEFVTNPIPPESAPMEDAATHSRWTLAGRGVDGHYRGQELPWVNSIQCRWYAWSAEHPETTVYERQP